MTIDNNDIKKVAAASTAALVAAVFVPAGVLLGLGAATAGAVYAYNRFNSGNKKDNGAEDADFTMKEEKEDEGK